MLTQEKADWYHEAEERDLLTPEKKEWFTEAKTRGLVPNPSWEQQTEKGAEQETAKEVTTAPSTMSDIVTQVGVGAAEAVIEAAQTTNDLIDFMIVKPATYIGVATGMFDAPEKRMMEEANKGLDRVQAVLPEAETTAGKITNEISQFTTGMIGAGKVLKGMGMANHMLRGYVAGAITDVAAFDSAEKTLADTLAAIDNPLASNIVTQTLARSKDDGEFVSKLKRGLEGVVTGGIADTIMRVGGMAFASAAAKANIKNAEKMIPRVAEATERFVKEGYNEETAKKMALKALKINTTDFTKKVSTYKTLDIDEMRTLSAKEDAKIVKQVDKFIARKDGVGGLNKVVRKMDETLGSLSTRIENYSPVIANHLRKFELESHVVKHEVRTKLDDFFTVTSKLSKQEAEEFGLGLSNGYKRRTDDFLSTRPELAAAYKKVRAYLDESLEQQTKAGIKVGNEENYFPRLVKDREGLMRSLGYENRTKLQKLIEGKEETLGRQLSVEEYSNEVSSYLTKYVPETLQSSKPSHMKGRSISVLGNKQYAFYADPLESLEHYISNTTDAIAKQKYFGLTKNTDDIIQAGTINDSVSSLLAKEFQAGNINYNDMEAIGTMLHARFGKGTKSPAEAIQVGKNVGYTALLAQYPAAVTQLGDVFISSYYNGVGNTVRSVLKSMRGSNRVDIEDLGINDAMQEMAGGLKSHKFLDSALKWSGFKKVDRLGKNTLINGSLMKHSKMAKTAMGQKQLREKFADMFEPGEIDNVIRDLKDGNITNDVKSILFTDLTKVQPVALSEMPEKYLRHPNGRVFYMLKTFTLKQIDLMRREAFQQWNQGNYKEATQNLLKYSALYGAGGVTSGTLKNLMLGRETDVEDEVVDNMFRQFGTSSYNMDNLKKGRVGMAIVNTALPPVNLLDVPGRDVANGKFDSLQYAPVFGKVVYNWFGGGLEKHQEKEAKKKRRELRDGK